jgi:ABC-type nickel/cobalt efflux system permease component RcnA
VAVMLVVLGANVLWKLSRGGTLHIHSHAHDNHLHAHPHMHEHARDDLIDQKHSHHALPFEWLPKSVRTHLFNSKRSVFIGMVHGMAGSAALMLIVLATIPSTALGLAYIAVFGVGSIGGMLVMSTLLGIPFVVTAHKSERLNLVVRGVSGILSVAFGLFLAWQIGIAEGLFM